MYVYIKSEANLWTVGFYKPDGEWYAESDHSKELDAVNRVILLNGGSPIARNHDPIKAYSKEFYDAMNNFEKIVPYGCKTDRVSKEDKENVPSGIWYDDGRTNELFKMYLHGYESAMHENRMEVS